MTMIPDARSGVASQNIQEILDASTNATQAMMQGQNQYSTPQWLAAGCASLLPQNYYTHVIDPQGAAGNLVRAVNAECRMVVEIDNRLAVRDPDAPIGKDIHRATGNCVRFGELIIEIYKRLQFECIVANPPFGLRWKTAHDPIDSTDWTWQFIVKNLAFQGGGFLISNITTLERLGITTHPWVYLVQEFPAGGIWDNCEVRLGIVHFCNSPHAGRDRSVVRWDHVPSQQEIAQLPVRFRSYGHHPSYGIVDNFDMVARAMAEEKAHRPKFNIYLDKHGMLRTYLSIVASVKMRSQDVQQLARINNCHPLSLVTEKETRDLLNQFLKSGIYTIQPEAKQAILDAIIEMASQATPITPVTDFELVAYADEEEALVCVAPPSASEASDMKLTPGKTYPIKTGTYTFKEYYNRVKLHYCMESDTTNLEDHNCELTGQDRYIEIYDDNNRRHRFMDRPNAEDKWCHSESLLWQIFKRPAAPTVADKYKQAYDTNLSKLTTHALISGFKYFDGQLDYYARVACKNYGLVGADVGTGKTLGALSLIMMRSPKRTLIIAPQGTMRSSGDEDDLQEYQPSQWVQEIRRFAPGEPVFQLFNTDDYRAILRANGGEFPPGIYITYPQAYWMNGAFEHIPDSWDPQQEVKFRKRMGIPFPEDVTPDDYLSTGVGVSANGIRCVATPSLATIIGSEQAEWDMVIVDEAHLMCNLDAQVTQNLLRLQPKFRYAMTATPIPNFVFNLFSLLGWLCVPDWHKGNRRNAAWPYSVDELSRFQTTFMSTERDITEQDKARARGDKAWSKKGIKRSPIISSPARLLKLLKPSMAYISKEQCNDKLMPCEVIDVRVPMGSDQAKLYEKWLNRGAYVSEYKNPLTIALVQMQRLRGICASPMGLEYNTGLKDIPGGKCRSDFNPKTIAILELIRDCLRRGEQVVVVSARVNQSDAIAARLRDSGVTVSRIDSSVPAELHTAEANRFKRGDATVMLMGIKCAQGHSFDQCPNLIIGSLEWSYGSLHQAKGRVWRLTSSRPVKVWCVLHKNTIEELLFDRVATKQDAATICLRGQRVPRDYMPLDASEVLAEHIVDYESKEAKSEDECESVWTTLRKQLVLR